MSTIVPPGRHAGHDASDVQGHTATSHPTKPSSSPENETSSKVDAMFSTVDTALGVLQAVAETTQNLPYIKTITGVLLLILKVKNEVDTCREKWRAIMDDVDQIRELLEDYHQQTVDAGVQDYQVPADLKKAFRVLERTLDSTLRVLDKCQAKRKRDHILLVLNRTQLTGAVDKCGQDLQKALNLFNTKLNIGSRIDTGKIWEAIQSKIKIVPIDEPPSGPGPGPELRARSDTMFGREREIEDLLRTISQQPPARIAILGPGGIGKTSLALEVLHHPQIEAEFHDARYFVACDSAQTADALLLEMANAFGILTDGSVSLESKILAFIRSAKCIVCFDNFETPWDAQTRLVEELLAKITSVRTATVLVTMRGTERPAKTRWTQPFFEPVPPLSQEAALQTFAAISGKSDAYATKLVDAVNHVPLAVYLLAYLAQSEPTADVWARWEEEHTSMIRRKTPDPLSSVDFSIKLSLQSPRMAAHPDALVLLSILSMLPDGMQMAKLQRFQRAFANLPYMRRALAVLRQNALVYAPYSGVVGVLSPIRLFMQSNHGPSVESIRGLKAYYLPLAEQGGKYVEPETQRELLPEVGNINSLLVFFFQHLEAADAGTTIHATLEFCRFCQWINLYEDKLLDLVDSNLKSDEFALLGDSCFLRAQFFQWTSRADAAEKKFDEALALHTKANDIKNQAHDLQYLGRLYLQISKTDEAARNLEKSLELHTELGDKMQQGYDLQTQARLLLSIAQFDKARDKLNLALKLHEEDNCMLGQAYDVEYLGTIHMQLAEYDKSMEKLEEAYKLHEQIGSTLGQANVVQTMGRVYSHLNQMNNAKFKFEKALDLHKKACDLLGQANDLTFLGEISIHFLDFDQARTYLQEALVMHKEQNDPIGTANTLKNLGSIHKHFNEIDKANSHFYEALQLHIQAQDHQGEAGDLMALGELALGQLDGQDACDKFSQACEISKKCSDPRGTAYALFSLSRVHMLLGENEKAVEVLTAAMDLHERTDAKYSHAWDLQQLGQIYLNMSQLEKSEEYMSQALLEHEELDDTLGQAYDLRYLATVDRMRIQLDPAAKKLKRAAELHEKASDVNGQANDLQALGQVYMNPSHLEEAEENLRKALELHIKAKNEQGQGFDLNCLGLVHTAQGKHEIAEEELYKALEINKKVNNTINACMAYRSLGELYQKLSKKEESDEMYMQAVILTRQSQMTMSKIVVKSIP